MADEDEDILIEESFAQKQMSKATFRRLSQYLRPYRRVLFLNILFTVLATGSQLLGPQFIQIGIDHFLTDTKNVSFALRGIAIISLLYLGNLLFGWWLSTSQVKTAIQAGQGAMNDLRSAVFAHIQKLSLNYFDKTHQGRIISRADTDIDSMDRILTWGANQLVGSLITLVGVLLFLLRYDWRLCMAISLVIPPLLIATRLFQIHGMRAYRRVRQQSSKITAALAENINGVRVVQAFAREDFNLAAFHNTHTEYASRALDTARIFHTYMPIVGLISGLGTAIVLGYGSSLVLQHKITVGELAAFILYLGMFFGPIQTMGDLYNAVLSTAASAERIFQLLDTDPQVVDRAGAVPFGRIEGRVEFRSIYFRYESTPMERWILSDISFGVEPGQTIALVGATGSGKTSVISLLARFYEPQKGSILIDGKDVVRTTIQSLRAQIAVVTQENFLFSGTVMENLKFARPQATDEEVIEAAKTLGTDGVIRHFADGYQTKVTERGANFSAGERQLLTFTRALVADPRILILDEATSAVDPATERLIQYALDELISRRTTFIIAHRLSTVINAHRILVLENGHILAQGSHRELLEQGGYYAELHKDFIGAH